MLIKWLEGCKNINFKYKYNNDKCESTLCVNDIKHNWKINKTLEQVKTVSFINFKRGPGGFSSEIKTLLNFP